jgi:MerR family transcriptional regulator, redox-sensitive transcriptional activator SoxR
VVIEHRLNALLPLAALVRERVAQPHPRAQIEDVLRRDPRLWQPSDHQQLAHVARVGAVALGALQDPLLTIGQVAERAGLRTSHIRFYERVGVLPEPARISGQRRYREDVLHRLAIIDVAQRAGLTLEEITPLTGPDNRSADASRQIRALADEKLPQIDALIARAQAVKHCSRSPGPATARAWTCAGCSSTRVSRRAARQCGGAASGDSYSMTVVPRSEKPMRL